MGNDYEQDNLNSDNNVKNQEDSYKENSLGNEDSQSNEQNQADNSKMNETNQYSSQNEYSLYNNNSNEEKKAERVTGEIYEAPQYQNQDNYQTPPRYNYENQYQNQNYSMPPNKEEEKKQSHPFRKFLFIVAGAAVFGLVAGGVFQGVALVSNFLGGGFKTDIQTQSETVLEEAEKIPTTTIIPNPVQASGDISAVVENTMPAIVSINSTVTKSYDMFGRKYNKNAEGSGSGIIVGKNDKELLIATNNHVVAGASKIAVQFIDEKVVEANIKGTDSTADLAVIAVKLNNIKNSTLKEIKIAVLGDSNQVKVGQMAIAIGNALGYGQSVTVGYISAKDREVIIQNETDGSQNKMKLLQTDAAINPGNSGGALLNLNGQVIGINSIKYADQDVEGMGYAIPISRANPIISELMSREKVKDSEKGYLGIEIEDVITEGHTKYGMPLGAFVKAVYNKSAAKEAGILVGDIITEVNGMEITNGTSLQEKINSYKAGTEVTLTINRYINGEYVEKEIKVVLKDASTIKDVKKESKDSNATSEQEKEEDYNYPNGYDEGDLFNDFFNLFP